MLIDGCNEKKIIPSSTLSGGATITMRTQASYLFNIFAYESQPRHKSLNGQYHLSTRAHITIFQRRFSGCWLQASWSRDNIRATASYAEAIFFSNSIFILSMIGSMAIDSSQIFLFAHSNITSPSIIRWKRKKSFPISPMAQAPQSQLWEARFYCLFLMLQNLISNNSSRLRMHC